MKRNSIAALLAAVFILGATAAIAAPVDLSIGGTAWYIWWKPAWADGRSQTVLYNSTPPSIWQEDSSDFKPSSNFMGGPMLSISFLERWSIQSVFTIGRFTATSEGVSRKTQLDPAGVDTGFTISNLKYTRDILKWDSDTSIGCAIHRMVKIFAGFKYQGYRFEERLRDYLLMMPTALMGRKLSDEVNGYGGGIGIGLTIPVIENFFILMSASGIALWSREKVDVSYVKSYIFDGTLIPLLIKPSKGRYFSYGGTASLSFAYNFEKINTTLSLGGRYQLLYNRQRYSKYNPLYNDVSMNIIDRQYDHFFGITLSAIYTFHIGKKA